MWFNHKPIYNEKKYEFECSYDRWINKWGYFNGAYFDGLNLPNFLAHPSYSLFENPLYSGTECVYCGAIHKQEV
jgi:hypothetical protein